MTPGIMDADVRVWVAIWLIAALFLLVRYWRSGSGVGLILTYVISFGSIHWLAAVLYLLPWYDTSSGDLVAEGMKQSAIALTAFAVGAELVNRIMQMRDQRLAPQTPRAAHGRPAQTALIRVSPIAATWFLTAGLLLYGVVTPFAGRLPTLSALVNTGSAVTVLGIGLKCWNAWQLGDRQRVWVWLMATTLLPFVTVATQGFLGYGMAALVTIYAFVAAFYGPRWKVLLVASLLGYLGLSVYVTYMRDRGDIRATVWGGSTLSDRVKKVQGTLGNFEWFDIHNIDHLARVDGRMNQDWLVGAAVVNLERGRVPYAAGSTYRDAALAVIPRAIWPSKPVSAGSGDLVATYTGLSFAKDTSVGIGQVMECYINFGTIGVVIGFFVIGGLMSMTDRRAVMALSTGNIARFTMWYLPGLSLLNVGGSFVEVTSTAGAGLVMAVALNRVIRQRMQVEALEDDQMLTHSQVPDAQP